ncbi:translation elongation factor 2 [Russula earlei]|uniref:Translation elongation factor 2 n=1 Tax=Russula earlei TaxID=71964 RepID=A0ACC0UMC4_9AGAM|nr:translation elongation factor 2 [Russula earlei]
MHLHSHNWRIPIARCVAFVTARITLRTVVRFISHGHVHPSKLRNLAICAHIDAGKTTLTESILLKSSFISTSGTVDAGSTTTDFLPAERERGITIQSASIPVKWKDWTFNLIDTPGHADFGMEVESASRVVDGAVVLIDSVEGVEAQTKGVWQQLDRYGVSSRILVLNKLDRPGASFHSSILSALAHRIHPMPVVLTLPIASFDPQDYSRGEPGIQGIVDLVKWELWRWSIDGSLSRHKLAASAEEIDRSQLLPPGHPLTPHLIPARTALLEGLAMFSNEFMEHLLELPTHPSAYLSVTESTILPFLRFATLKSGILPVLCGSATKHIGTEIIMDYAGGLLASPLDVSHEASTSRNSVRLLAWKVSWDKRRGWMTFVRVYSGTLSRQSVLFNSSRGVKERVSKLLLLYASEAEEVDELPFGSVGVILGLKHTRTGDTLLSTHRQSKDSSFPGINPPPTTMSASVIPQSHADLEPVEVALNALIRTDPSVRMETHEGQLLVHGLGGLHLEIVEGRLKDEWGVKCEFGRRRVTYRERIGPDESQPPVVDWTTGVGGKNVTASVSFSLRPLLDNEVGDSAWDDNIVIRDDGKPLSHPDAFHDEQNPWTHISRGIASMLSSSPHTSFPLSRSCIQVLTFKYPLDVPPSILGGASAIILRDQIKNRGRGSIMEPYIHIRVSVDSDVLGQVMKDLVEHGGEIADLIESRLPLDEEASTPYGQEGVYIPPKWLSPSSISLVDEKIHSMRLKRPVHAVAPLSQMLDYSTRLRAISGGHGQFEMAAAGFRAVSPAQELKVLTEIGRA